MKKLLSITVTALSLVAYSPAALSLVAHSPAAFSAFDGLYMMRVGEWEMHFSGNVNAFYTFVDCDGADAGPVAVGLACGSVLGDRQVSDVRTGLLPAWLKIHARTETESGIKTAIHLSLLANVGVESQAPFGGISGASGVNTSNFRQAFLTFGNDDMGTIKIGDFLGVFTSDAIINDMTILGVGTVSDGTAGSGHASVGRVGIGYPYANWKSQIQYESPDYNGFSFTVAVLEPWEVFTLGTGHLQIPAQAQDTPSFEGKINYSGQMNDVDLSLWTSFVHQSIDFVVPQGVTQDNLDATGWELGAKISNNSFSLVGYYYEGEGIGTTVFLFDALGPDSSRQQLEERDSDGFYVQGTVTLPNTWTKIGLSYGESNLDMTSGETLLDSGHLLKSNASWIVGIYQPLSAALHLVAEHTNTKSQAQAGYKAEENVFALGAIMFF